MKTSNMRSLLLGCILLTITLTTRVAQPVNRNISEVGALRPFPTRGIEIKSSYSGGRSVTVEMNGINSQVYYECGRPVLSFIPLLNEFPYPNTVPTNMQLYQTALSASIKGSISEGTGINGTVYNTESFFLVNRPMTALG